MGRGSAYDRGVTAPASWLCKLPVDDEVAAGKVRGLGAAVPELVAAGWLTARKDGRAVLVRLTEAGRAERTRFEAAAPAAKPRAKRAAAPTATARLAALEAAVAALTARVAALEAAPPPAVEPAPTTPAVEPAALREQIVAIVAELDARDRLGGLVPIPEVRRALRTRGVAAADAEVDAALEALERAWTIDLSVAQAPTQVADRSAGIERPGRGLLYYVARR